MKKQFTPDLKFHFMKNMVLLKKKNYVKTCV